jgi:hypothetical protein
MKQGAVRQIPLHIFRIRKVLSLNLLADSLNTFLNP